jgi:hypothetical protein
VLNEWDIAFSEENLQRFVYHVVSDTVSVNSKFIQTMGYNWIPCSCHLLNLVVKDSLEVVKILLHRHRNLVSHIFIIIIFIPLLIILKVRFFRKSPKMNKRLLKLQQGSKDPKTLIGGCATRWSGTFYMLKR